MAPVIEKKSNAEINQNEGGSEVTNETTQSIPSFGDLAYTNAMKERGSQLTATELLQLIFDEGTDVAREEGDLSSPQNPTGSFQPVELTREMVGELMYAKVNQKNKSDA